MTDYLDETIDIYNSVASTYASQALVNSPVRQQEYFVSLLPTEGKILDVGCGSGRDCAFFSEKGFKVTGIDRSEKLLELARIAAPRAKFYSADMRKLSFEKNMFDGIWACASILHIKHTDVADVFKSFFSILKPEGILFVNVKKGEGEKYLEESSIPGKKRFYSLFSKEKLRKYCKDAGFTVLEIEEYTSHGNGTTVRTWRSCFAKKV